MKTRILIDIDKEDADFETRAILNAVKNQVAIDSLHSDLIRPITKYSDDEKLVEIYEEIWEKLKDHFSI